ncbi:serine/threonine-protein kinase PRP4 homolog [Danaus plexippus]|uniref:serine/threonine-protein kinase PRP4 homolog n=1 Tax=Danaus plexippus TaxID=13037 RepID=UPI002AAFD340|nr:serine/threonine-protein kinase PRP4 homolog [Danaus plexippus]XP_032519523.2 serine/threonine-protein kinase PRP4 homolog [Danaus plexippus]XP_061384005.1 serine/threonine-protein kinase PRP4 homolog [Danaus plexippus]
MSEKYSKINKNSSKSDKNNKKRGSHYSESTTPPLPKQHGNSIEELMKQRQYIRDELKNIANSKTKSDIKIRESKKRRHETIDKVENKLNVPTKVSKHESYKKDSSPKYIKDYLQLDSEDEENIIEQRRRQRKQLLDKLGKTEEKSELNGTQCEKIQETVNSHQNQKYIELKCKTTSEKLVTDMFSEEDFTLDNISDKITQDSKENSELKDNWDDSEGYYKINVGDMIYNSRYTIKNLLGQGVFSNVVKAQDNNQDKLEVAIKILRNNDLMHKTGLKELKMLREINDADPNDKFHCVRYQTHFIHKGHLCLVLESLHMDLRSVLKKYGKHHGINIKALTSYSRQLLLALRLLKKIGIVHADIKPDNILVNEKKNVLKLCDFGSASKIKEHEPTPYLVSRFYRAPEIILGIPYLHSVDVWSAACTIYEMATGKILFMGGSNNKMLKCFMDLKGRFPSRIIRRAKFKDQHFNYNNNFLLHKTDEFTGKDKFVEISNIITNRDLYKELKKGYKNPSSYEEEKITQLKEMLEKMLTLDSNFRVSATDCLKHPFIQDVLKK